MLPHKIIDRLLNWENDSDKALFVVGSPLYAQSRETATGTRHPTATSFIQPHNPRT